MLLLPMTIGLLPRNWNQAPARKKKDLEFEIYRALMSNPRIDCLEFGHGCRCNQLLWLTSARVFRGRSDSRKNAYKSSPPSKPRASRAITSTTTHSKPLLVFQPRLLLLLPPPSIPHCLSSSSSSQQLIATTTGIQSTQIKTRRSGAKAFLIITHKSKTKSLTPHPTYKPKKNYTITLRSQNTLKQHNHSDLQL
jgi:hypothetical protein